MKKKNTKKQEVRGWKKRTKIQISVIMKNMNRLYFLKNKDCQTKLQMKSNSILCTSDI